MKIVVGAILTIIILSAGYFFLGMNGTSQQSNSYKTYASDQYGISFSYPKQYYLEEKEVGNGERWHHVIILTEDTEENKAVREGKSPGREGPVAITIDIYQNNLDGFSVERWIKGTNDSNYKLSPDGTLENIEIGGLQGLSYRWSGLYEARSSVVAHEDAVFMFSVTYLSPEDSILRDFDELLKNIRINY